MSWARRISSSGGLAAFMAMPVLRTRGAQLLMAVRLLMAFAFHMFAPIWQVREVGTGAHLVGEWMALGGARRATRGARWRSL